MDMSSNPLTPDARAVERLPYVFAKRHGVISARQLGAGFEIWVRHGVRAGVLAEVQRALGGPLDLRELANDAFEAALARAYERGASHAADIVTDLDANPDLVALAESLPKVADLLESEDDAPIVRLINALFSQAVREGASDIHIEAFEGRSVVRFRRDGMLRDVLEPPQVVHGVIVSRIKIMARLDIAEKRQPQDGRIALRLAGRSVDVRVSILPTAHGERVVLRLLDKQAGRLDLTGLGMADTTLTALRELVKQPHGIILVTGPTGSGKTTTLYAALGQLDAKRTNIVTAEDPIEYDLDGGGQTQVNPRSGLTFARALRAILRQDPRVVVHGEIREGADGVGGGLGGEWKGGVWEGALLPGSGCEAGAFTGYQGRTGIFELLLIDDEARRLIHDRASEANLREHARRGGMKGLREDGLRWVRAGETSLEEVLRVSRE